MTSIGNPFQDPPPPEIKLDRAPLERVIAQVQFPTMIDLVERPSIGALQKVLGTAFPVLEEQQVRSYYVDLQGMAQTQVSSDPLWRFSHPDTGFSLQITATAITLETTQYDNRLDFFERFLDCLKAIHQRTPIAYLNRLGVRYVDRVSGPSCNTIRTLIRPECRGVASLPLAFGSIADIHDFHVPVPHEKGILHGRMGFLPPGTTFDPTVLPPLQEENWALDLDMYRQGELFAFEPETLVQDASTFALRIYAVFRWLVTPGFLQAFGGKL